MEIELNQNVVPHEHRDKVEAYVLQKLPGSSVAWKNGNETKPLSLLDELCTSPVGYLDGRMWPPKHESLVPWMKMPSYPDHARAILFEIEDELRALIAKP